MPAHDELWVLNEVLLMLLHLHHTHCVLRRFPNKATISWHGRELHLRICMYLVDTCQDPHPCALRQANDCERP